MNSKHCSPSKQNGKLWLIHTLIRRNRVLDSIYSILIMNLAVLSVLATQLSYFNTSAYDSMIFVSQAHQKKLEMGPLRDLMAFRN